MALLALFPLFLVPVTSLTIGPSSNPENVYQNVGFFGIFQSKPVVNAENLMEKQFSKIKNLYEKVANLTAENKALKKDKVYQNVGFFDIFRSKPVVNAENLMEKQFSNIENLHEQVSNLTAEVANRNAEVANLTAEVINLTAEVKALKKDKKKLKRTIKEFMPYFSIRNKIETVEMLFVPEISYATRFHGMNETLSYHTKVCFFMLRRENDKRSSRLQKLVKDEGLTNDEFCSAYGGFFEGTPSKILLTHLATTSLESYTEEELKQALEKMMIVKDPTVVKTAIIIKRI